ncbi:chromodomain helicase DNA binding protein kismet isoform X3 [Amblyomma americanum]
MAEYQLLGGDGYGQGMEDGSGSLAGYGAASQDLVSPLMVANPMGSTVPGTSQMAPYSQMHPGYPQPADQKMHYAAYGAGHVAPEYGARVHPMGEQQSAMIGGYSQQSMVGQRMQASDQYPYGTMGAPQRSQDMWRGHYMNSGAGYQQHTADMGAQHTVTTATGVTSQHHRTSQGQYGSSQDYSLHTPQQHGSPQRPPYGPQGNGTHVAQLTSKAAAATATHMTDQSMTPYPQTTYPSAQTSANRSTYGTAGAMSHSAVAQSMPTARTLRPGGYATSSSSSQAPIPQGSPARMQQYPQSAYSPGHPFSGSDATSPSHLSPYPTQAPNSPQYRGSYPSPRRPTTTPPAGSPSVVTSQQSSSQGSYPSPGATHLSSPGQVLSPGSGATASATPVASSSLQQLEQMVMPHMATAKPPPTGTSSTGSYYGSSVQQSYGPAQAQQSLGYGVVPSTAQHHSYPSPNLMSRSRPLAGTPEASSFGASEVGPMAAGSALPARSDYAMGATGPARTAPVSPASYGAYPQQQPVSSLGYEQAQQQLQHLYSVPQTAQTQKRISELQERLRILQQQQQPQQSALLSSVPAPSTVVPGMGSALGGSLGPMGSPTSMGAYPSQYPQGAASGVPAAPYSQPRQQMPSAAPAQQPQQLPPAQQQPHPQLPPYGPQAQQQLLQNSQLQPQPLQAQSLQPQSLQPQALQPQSLQPPALQPQTLQPQPVPPQSLQPQTVQPQGLQPQALQPQGLQPQPQQQGPASVGMAAASSSVSPQSPTVSTLFPSMADSYRPPSQPPSLPTPMISDQDLQSSLPPLPLAGVPSVVPAVVDDLCPLEGPLSSSLDVPYTCPLPPEDPYLLPPDDVLPPIEPMTKRKPSRSKKKAKTSHEMPPLGLGPGEGLMPPEFMMPPESPGSMPLLLPQPPCMEVPPAAAAKKSKKRKPKEPKEGEPPKEPKPKKPKKPKAPKPPKEPKEGGAPRRKSKSKKKNSAEQAPAPQVSSTEAQDPGAPPPEVTAELPEGGTITEATAQAADAAAPTDEAKTDAAAAQPVEEGKTPKKKSKEKKEKKEPKAPKEATPKTPKAPKKKLPRLSLKFSKKKKRKRLGSSDKSDLEGTPPPSPEECDGVQKRRSSRNTHRKKYTDDIELQLSGDEGALDGLHIPHTARGQGAETKNVQVLVNVVTEDTMVVEKILASRMSTRKSEDEDKDSVEVEEFFVKYKNLSYIHCDWKTLEELEMTDKRVLQKVKRFRQKKDNINSIFDFLEDEPFNPDYVEVDRILDMTETVDPIESEEANQSDVKDEKPDQIEEIAAEGKEKAEPMEIEPEEQNGNGEKECRAQEQTGEDGDKEPLAEKEPLIDTCLPAEETKKEPSGGSPKTPSAPAAVTEGPDSGACGGDGEGSPMEHSIKKELPDEEPPSSVKPEDEDVFEDNAAVPIKTDPLLAPKVENTEQVKADSSDGPNGSKGKVARTTHKHYLVKWRGLSYEESTWELEEDVDPLKVEHFLRFKDPPPKEKWKVKKRPKPSEWKQIDESPVYKGGNTLREYQLEGLSWLTFCWYNGQNCILADEMGLGKTIQSLTFINEIVRYGINGPFLVIAPLSTIGNWQREFETWTDLNVITYHGSSASRNMIQEYEMYYKDENGQRITDVFKFQVMITTFEIVLSDCMELQALPWRACVIDEAHRLKNRNCKLLEGLRMLNLEHSVLLTGTPLQNNVEELFSLLNFLEPSRFSSTETFMEEFGDLKTEGQVDKLKALLKPMMLRRLKEDVEKSLAPKEETIVEVELTNIQKKYYRAILERNFAFLTKGGVGTNVPNLMNTMMELRKCCIHPYLIKGAEEQILQEYRLQHGDSLDMTLNALVQASGKLVLLDKLLPKLKDGGHRVLVFSQMVRCLDLLEDYLVHKRYPYERIDGRVRGNLRQAAIDRFCKPDSDRFVFLLCTRAGGLGINLTAADTVIIFDSDWNPQNDLQAQARCHRIGQSKAVKVYRLICRNTYEREMFDKASLKLGLDRAVLQSMNSQKESLGVNQQLTKQEIEDLLRKGAYGAIMDDDGEGNNFCEEDIDQILLRRTHTITIESEGKGSTFSKASFTASSTRSDIEIDDPNFWEKWAKKANLDVDELKGRNELILQEPRRRTQTKRFGTDDNMLDLSELESSDEDDETGVRTRGSRRSRHRDSPVIGGRARRGGRASRGFSEDEFLGDIAPGNWTRTECFQVEKGLLTFGWGRWEESIAIGLWRRRVTAKDVEDISRVVLLYCLRHYKGDEKIKGFIWDLIAPTEDGETRIHKNHSGLSAPVPRGRKGKKLKNGKGEPDSPDMLADWARDDQYNPDLLLCDDGYRKHLHRHANKVLLRVRLLYYLKHEIIGELHQQVFAGVPARDIPIPPPTADGEPPAPWWDEDADKSLLIGVYKHGYERFNLMRQDHTLCFLARCGPPDGAALLAEMTANPEDLEDKREEGKKDLDEEDPVSPEPSTSSEAKPPSEPSEQAVPSTGEQPVPAAGGPIVPASQVPGELGTLEFPTPSDLNTRLRRIITMYQRNHKKRELINAQRARIITALQVEGFNFVNRMERREKFEAAIREREIRRLETQQRWSRREEAEFYRAVSCYGVDYRRQEQRFVWEGFRTVGRLERKRDDTLTEYFRAFRAMCRRVCGRKLGEEDDNLQYVVEPISEERATRCLQRIELLSKIREEILPHPELDERLKLCQPSMDLPDWWICGRHDKDLLIGAAKYGLSRMDYHLLNDGDLSFREVVRAQSASKPPMVVVSHHGPSFPLVSATVDTAVPATAKATVDSNQEVLCPETVTQAAVVLSKDENSDLPQVSEVKVDNSCELKVDSSSESEKVASECSGEAAKVTLSEDHITVTSEKNEESTVQPARDDFKEEQARLPDVFPADEKMDVDKPIEKSPEDEEQTLKDSTEENPGEEMEVDEAKSEMTSEADEDLEVKTLEQTPEEGSTKKQQQIELLEVPLIEPKKIEEEDVEDVPVQQNDSDKVVAESAEVEKAEIGPLNGNEAKDEELHCEKDVSGIAEESHQEQPTSCNTTTLAPVSSLSMTCALLELPTPRVVLPPPVEDDNSKTDVEKTDTEQDPAEMIPCGSKMPLTGFPPFRVLTPQLTEESQETNSQQDDVLSQESFNLDGEGGTEPPIVHFMTHSTRNPVRWPKDKVLQIRLEYIVHAVEKKEWPVPRQGFTLLPATPTESPSSPVASSVASGSEQTPHATPEHIATPVVVREQHPPPPPPPPPPSVLLPDLSARLSPAVVAPSVAATATGIAAATTVSTTVEMAPVVSVSAGPHSPIPPAPSDDLLRGTRRRRRRRRFEIEAERAKLRALLSHNLQQQQLKQLQQFLAPPPPPSTSSLPSTLATATAPVSTVAPSTPPGAGAVAAAAAAVAAATTVGAPSPQVAHREEPSKVPPPPPAHQGSSSVRGGSTSALGMLDLRVKAAPTPPPAKASTPAPPSEEPPMDLSSGGSAPTTSNLSAAATMVPSVRSALLNGSVAASRGRGGGRGRRSGGSRIDALALNLQARKQQQLREEHRQPGSSADEREDSDASSTTSAPALPPPTPMALPMSGGKLHVDEKELERLLARKSRHEEPPKSHKSPAVPLSLSSMLSSSVLPHGADVPSSSRQVRDIPSLSSVATSLPGANKAVDSRGGSSALQQQQQQQQQQAAEQASAAAAMHQDLKRWLDDHPELMASHPSLTAAAAAMAFSPMPSLSSHQLELLELPESRRRGRRPRLDPSKLDPHCLTGDENVSVINRLTGKKITGSKAPPLKHLAEWLDKNPMFDVDPKWAQLVKERRWLQHSKQNEEAKSQMSQSASARRKRGHLPEMPKERVAAPESKRGRRTAASLLSSLHQAGLGGASSSSGGAANLGFPSTSALNPLSFSSSMLGNFPGLKFFMEPGKSSAAVTSPSTSSATHPLFLPFGGLAGMGLANPLFSFPGLGFQGLPFEEAKETKAQDGERAPSKERHNKGSPSSSSSLPTSSASLASTSFPFLYPSGLLYNPLGLGGFSLPTNMSASFASLAQAGLVNGLGGLGSVISSAASKAPSASLASSRRPAAPSVTSALGAGLRSSVLPPPPASSTTRRPAPIPPPTLDSDDESLMGNDMDDLDDLDDRDNSDELDEEPDHKRPREERPKKPEAAPHDKVAS